MCSRQTLHQGLARRPFRTWGTRQRSARPPLRHDRPRSGPDLHQGAGRLRDRDRFVGPALRRSAEARCHEKPCLDDPAEHRRQKARSLQGRQVRRGPRPCHHTLPATASRTRSLALRQAPRIRHAATRCPVQLEQARPETRAGYPPQELAPRQAHDQAAPQAGASLRRSYQRASERHGPQRCQSARGGRRSLEPARRQQSLQQLRGSQEAVRDDGHGQRPGRCRAAHGRPDRLQPQLQSHGGTRRPGQDWPAVESLQPAGQRFRQGKRPPPLSEGPGRHDGLQPGARDVPQS
ncbi:hypothetical protein D3C72_928260 [compost metagenome]